MISPLLLKPEINMFVYDTETDTADILNFPHTLEDKTNNNLNKLKEYFDYKRFSVNVPKYVFMLIGSHQTLTKYA